MIFDLNFILSDTVWTHDLMVFFFPRCVCFPEF
jgi:hypothetical protein